MGSEHVDKLLQRGVVRRVAADPEAAAADLDSAKRHLESVAEIAEIDPEGAFSLAYDAARKAIGAHMRAHGFRPGSGPGAHEKTGQYAIAALGADTHLEAFDDMRTVRNRTEYDAQPLQTSDAYEARDHAQAIVAIVEAHL